MTGTSNYILAQTGSDPESARLALLAGIFDPGTTGRLDALGIEPGARCLEVGAGNGSIARWFADRVGPSGQVVAADIDCRFLRDLPGNVEVRRLDIVTDELEPDHYDLAHCRAVLTHVSDPLAALRRMAAALRPGGALLVEEADFSVAGYAGHPDAGWATDLTDRIFGELAAAKIVHSYLGQDLPGLFEAVGVRVSGGVIGGSVTRAPEPRHEWWRLSMEALLPGLLGAGLLSEADAERLRRVIDDPETVYTTFADVSVWGRRPS
jgi:SAM-dependent methyltransferase